MNSTNNFIPKRTYTRSSIHNKNSWSAKLVHQRKFLIVVFLTGFTLVYLCFTLSLDPLHVNDSSYEGGTLASALKSSQTLSVSTEFEISGSKTESGSKKPAKIECRLPVLDPFDPSILEFVQDPNPISCSNHTKYPLLFTTDLHSTLIQINDPAKFGYYFCCYSSFTRLNGIKSEVGVSQICEPITEGKTLIPENVEFLQISCTTNESSPTETGLWEIVDIFGFIRLKTPPETVEAEKIVVDEEHLPTKPNYEAPMVDVVILGLDGVSHMNFIRTMPQTFQYLTRNLSGIGLSGYTKVGDNTFPNIVPVTTGLFVEELTTLSNCWTDTDPDAPFDDCPFIWKNYSSRGYTTAFGEDAVWMGIFNYLKGGFSQQPTDHYFNTLTSHQDSQIGHDNLLNAITCYGPRLSFQVLLDYMKKMAVAMAEDNQHYFEFIWATALFHDDLNTGKLGDGFLLETLEWFKNEGYLDDTVLVLMSDHGARWGGIRTTFQGKIEERMPFLYFVFPDWFQEQYASAVNNVIENKLRLTTPFDLHETLKNLLFLENIQSDKILERSANLDDLLSSGESLPRGISLFLEIPEKRSCPDAEIPDHWCLCHTATSVRVEKLHLVDEAGQSVVRSINDLFKKYPQCVTLYLDEVLNAQEVDVAHDELEDTAASVVISIDPHLNQEQVTFSLSLRVVPSNATFEATVTRHTDDGPWLVSGEISRTNLYGEQSHCVSEYNLKRFCYCG